MRRSGPLITLLVGLATGIIVITLSVNATNQDAGEGASAQTGTASPTPSPTVSPPQVAPPETTAPAPEEPGVTYAGRVDGGGATVAIAVSGGQAVAYVCDGRQIEAWLQGPASAGTLALTGPDGASLGATYGNGVAAGSVAAGGKQWVFTAPVAPEPAGLYRATAMVAGARVVGGWIVLPDGTQVGVVTTDGRPAAAPPLDVPAGQATVDGTPVAAEIVDGAPLNAQPTATTGG